MRALLLLLLPSAALAASSAQVCANTIDIGMPACHQHAPYWNETTLYVDPDNDYNSHHSLNCASCDCPSSFQGLNCDQCNDNSVCSGSYYGGNASVCTRNSIAPYGNETDVGKNISCTLGGVENAWTSYIMSQQPNTGIQFNFQGENNLETKPMVATLNGFGGVPSQFNPIYEGRYNYSYAWYFSSLFDQCTIASVDVSVCEGLGDWGDFELTECIRYLCEGMVDTNCPPPGVPSCPKTAFGTCTTPAGEKEKYWAHTCTGAPPDDATQFGLYCSATVQPGLNNSFLCYADLQMASPFSMVCTTGSCSANLTSPALPSVAADVEITTQLVLGATVGSLAGLLFFSGVGYVRSDRKSRRAPKHTLAFMDEEDGGRGAALEALVPELGAPAQLEFYDMTYAVGAKKILRGASAVAAPSDVSDVPGILAILGPSGAGKSTLLDVLAGRKRTGSVGGLLKLNGEPVAPKDMGKVSGYVLQEDILPGTLTVREYLSFRATLMLPPTVTARERETRVARLIAALGLHRCADSFIGDQFRRGVSGGERRRVSIGGELVLKPALLFLDEPTTGLDSANAAAVVELLDRLSQAGVIVIMTIHQPRRSIFRRIHRLLLLSDRGQMIFSGPAQHGLDFFAQQGHRQVGSGNPADFLVDTVIGLSSEEMKTMVDAFQLEEAPVYSRRQRRRTESLEAAEHPFMSVNSESGDSNQQRRPSDPNVVMSVVSSCFSFLFGSQSSDTVAGMPVKYHSGFFSQMRWLCWRLVRNTMRHPFTIAVQFVACLLMSLVLAGVDHDMGFDTFGLQNRFGLLFFLVLYLGMMSLSSVPVWKEERILFLHERAQGCYGTVAYFTSVVLFDVIPLRILPPFFFLFITYPLVGLHPDCGDCLVDFALVLVLTNLCATGLSMSVGAMPLSGPVANVVGSVLMLTCALFGGWLISDSSIPEALGWLKDVSFVHYAFQALVVNEFLTQVPDDQSKSFIYSGSVCGADIPDFYTSGRGVLSDLGYPTDQDAVGSGMRWLATLFAVFLALTLALLLMVQHVSFALPTKEDFKKNLAQLRRKRIESRASSADFGDLTPLIAVPDVDEYHGDQEVVSVALDWLNVNYHVTVDGEEKHIIKNVSGLVPGGSVMALLGPSGAGKTTLLDIIAGRKNTGEISGRLSVAGLETTAEDRRSAFGYVLQEDVLPGAVTVTEYLSFNARLRMPSTTPQEQRMARVDAVIESLSLRKCANGLIGDSFMRGISGGEKRRVSIGSELLTQPRVLCLDEPTTGLDATNAAKVVQIISGLARSGVTCILSIHQPREDVLKLLDQVTLLSRHGQVTFCGPTSQALAFFSEFGLQPDDPAMNPADYCLDLVMGAGDEIVDRLVEGFSTSKLATDSSAQRLALRNHPAMASLDELHRKHAAPFGVQVAALLRREVRMMSRHPFLIGLHFVLGALAAAGLGGIFQDKGDIGPDVCEESSECPNGGCWDYQCYVGTPGIQDRFGVLFFVVLYLMLMSLSSLPVWIEAQGVFIRERASGVYGTKAYFASVVLFDFGILRTLPPVFFALISYHLIGLHAGSTAVGWFVAITIGTNFCASAMSMSVGAMASTAAVANALGSFLIMLFAMLGGFLVNASTFPDSWRWVAKLSFANVAYNALLINEFEGQGPFRYTSESSSVTTPSGVLSGTQVLSCFGFETDSFTEDVAILGGMVVAYLVLTFLLLHYLFKERR